MDLYDREDSFMPLRYKCRHCETELGQIPYDTVDTMKRLQLTEVGEIDDFIELDAKGDATVQCICEHCEDSLRQFPHYHSLKKWIQ